MKMKTKSFLAIMSMMAVCSVNAQAQIPQQSIRWDKHSLIFDGKRVVPVVLRLGPFCHGEVRNGGIPD